MSRINHCSRRSLGSHNRGCWLSVARFGAATWSCDVLCWAAIVASGPSAEHQGWQVCWGVYSREAPLTCVACTGGHWGGTAVAGKPLCCYCRKAPQDLKFLAELVPEVNILAEEKKSGVFSEVHWFLPHLALDASAPYIPVISDLCWSVPKAGTAAVKSLQITGCYKVGKL